MDAANMAEKKVCLRQPALEIILKELNKWCVSFSGAIGDWAQEEAVSLVVVVLLSILRRMVLTDEERRCVHREISRLSEDQDNAHLAQKLRRGKGGCSFESALQDLA